MSLALRSLEKHTSRRIDRWKEKKQNGKDEGRRQATQNSAKRYDAPHLGHWWEARPDLHGPAIETGTYDFLLVGGAWLRPGEVSIGGAETLDVSRQGLWGGHRYRIPDWCYDATTLPTVIVVGRCLFPSRPLSLQYWPLLPLLLLCYSSIYTTFATTSIVAYDAGL